MRFRDSVVWGLAAVFAVLAGIGGALVWFRPDHVTLPPLDDTAPQAAPQPAPPSLAQAAGRKPSIDR
jgi:hypothetical protein